MAVSLDHDPAAVELARRARELVADVVIPAERRTLGAVHDGPAAERR
jgi:hypothetical protein